MASTLDDETLEALMQSTVEGIAKEHGISFEDARLQALSAAFDPDAVVAYFRRYAKVLQSAMQLQNLSEEDLVKRARIPGGRLFDGETLFPQSAVALLHSIPEALGIDPIVFNQMVHKEAH